MNAWNPRIRVRAHRFAYETRIGAIPNGLLIMHKCDVKLCCNPRHLQPGTQLDNMQDAANKGRMASGERGGWRTKPERVARGDRHMSRTHPEAVARGDRHGLRRHPEKLCRGQNRPQAKLNDDSVREIRRRRAAGEIQRELAAEFLVCEATISDVINGRKSWKHVT